MNEYDLTEFDKVASSVNLIRDKGDFIPDCSTREGYEASKRFCLDYSSKAKKALTEAHQKTKAPFLKTSRLLDEKKRELMIVLEDIEAPHKLAYKAHDEEEKQNKERFDREIIDKIQVIIDHREGSTVKTSEELGAAIRACGEINTSEGFFHFKDKAVSEKQKTLEILNAHLVQAARAELVAEQVRVANEKQLLADYEVGLLLNKQFDRDALDKIAIEKEQEERRLAENIEALKRKEEVIEQRAKQQEIDRQEKERVEIEAEDRRRSEDEKNVMKINMAAVYAVVNNCQVTDEQAELFIKVVSLNLIPNVSIKY